MVGLDRFVWHGDATQSAKSRFVRQPCEFLMTTPESLEVMLVSPRVPAARVFADLRYVVVDEVHAFAGADRRAHPMSVLERLRVLSKQDVQRISLSATVGNPEYIARWLRGSSTGSTPGTGADSGAAMPRTANWVLPRFPSKTSCPPSVRVAVSHAATTTSPKSSGFLFCRAQRD